MGFIIKSIINYYNLHMLVGESVHTVTSKCPCLGMRSSCAPSIDMHMVDRAGSSEHNHMLINAWRA